MAAFWIIEIGNEFSNNIVLSGIIESNDNYKGHILYGKDKQILEAINLPWPDPMIKALQNVTMFPLNRDVGFDAITYSIETFVNLTFGKVFAQSIENLLS